jgi:hydrogenase maturation factor
MCVGIPRKIVEISNPETNLAMIEINGKKHEINIAFLFKFFLSLSTI